MNSVKLNKKHLFSFFITLVLLFSFNLNVFAENSHIVNLYNSDFLSYYLNTNNSWVDCSSKVSKTESNVTINKSSYHCTRWAFPSSLSIFDKMISLTPDLSMYTKTDYKYDFYFKCGEVADCECILNAYIRFSNGVDEPADINLAWEYEFISNEWVHCSGSFTTPNMTGNVFAFLSFTLIETNDGATVGNNFYCTDIVLTVDSPLYGDEIATPSTDDLNNYSQNYDDLIDSLPTVDSAEINDLMNFDFGSFADGMNFVRDIFDRTLTAFSFNSVLLFSLVFGLACLILGRKAGN